MANKTDPGLPGDSIDNRRKRHAMRFTLPAIIRNSKSWKESGLPDADLSFTLAEATTADETEARRFARGDQMKMADRLQDMCTIAIGDNLVQMNEKRLTKWKDAIGPKGRKLVEAKWVENYMVTAEELSEMEATAESVFV